MIDAARALLERVVARKRAIADTVARLVDEDERLEAMRDSLVAFIEHPEQALDDGHAVSVQLPAPESQPGSVRTGRQGTPAGSVGSPTPASPDGKVACPDCHERLKPQGIGTHRRVRHGVTGRAESTPAPPTARCAECDKEVKSGGMGTHRRQAHGRRTTLVERMPAASPVDVKAPKARPDGSVQCPTCLDWFVSPGALGPHRRGRHGHRAGQPTEQYLCARCSEPFPSRDSRDAHQAQHVTPGEPRAVGRNPTTRRDGTPAGVPIA